MTLTSARARARRLYRELERTLRREPGIAPQPMVRELYEQARRLQVSRFNQSLRIDLLSANPEFLGAVEQ